MASTILPDIGPESASESKPTEKKKRKKKIPGVYKRGSRWIVDTYYRGLRIRESFATPEMAEANLFKMKSLIDEGRFLEKKRRPKETIGEFATRYLDWCESMKEKAYFKKKARLSAAVEWIGKDTLLGDVTREIIEKYQAERLTQIGPKEKIVCKATVNRDVSVIRNMFRKAVEWGVMTNSPLNGIRKFKETGRRLRYLTPDECCLLLSKCGPTLKEVVLLALHTGLRKSEILHLTWENINLRDRNIELTDQKNSEHSFIPLNQTAIDTMRSIPRRLDSNYVFTGKVAGKPYYDLKRCFEKAVMAAKLENVTFHTLRHYVPCLTMSSSI